MSIIGKLIGIFESPIEDLEHLASDVWDGFKSVWYILTHTADLLSSAWNWMYDGALWLADQTGKYAEDALNAVEHTLVTTIPKAIEWGVSEAWNLADHEAVKLYNTVVHATTGTVKDLRNDVVRIAHEAEGDVNETIKWGKGAVQWVEQFGVRVWYLLSHPEHIAKWLVKSLAGPLVIELMRLGAPVLVYILHGWSQHDSDIAHIIEDVLSKVA